MMLVYDRASNTLQLLVGTGDGQQIVVPVDTTKPAPDALLEAKAAASSQGGE